LRYNGQIMKVKVLGTRGEVTSSAPCHSKHSGVLIDGELYGHTGVPNLFNLFKKFTRNILFLHFGSWFYEDIDAAKKKLWQLGSEQGMSVQIGYDGMEVDIKETMIKFLLRCKKD